MKNPQQNIDARQKYFNAFIQTQIRIWQDRIQKLGIVDTGKLLTSVMTMPDIKAHDRDYINVGFYMGFLEYGIWQNYGSGRETPRGNSGDIGRARKRVPRPWFAPKLARSMHNIAEFWANSLGMQAVNTVTNAFVRRQWGNKKAR